METKTERDGSGYELALFSRLFSASLLFSVTTLKCSLEKFLFMSRLMMISNFIVHVAFLKIKTKMQRPFLSFPDFPSEKVWNKGYFDQKISPF